MVSEDIETIGDLSKQVAQLFGITASPESLRFSVDGYTAPWGSSAKGVLRNGDVVVVEVMRKPRIQARRTEVLESSKLKKDSIEKRMTPLTAGVGPPHPQKRAKRDESLKTTTSVMQTIACKGAVQQQQGPGPSLVKKAAAEATSSPESLNLSEESAENISLKAGLSAGSQKVNVSKPSNKKLDTSNHSEESEALDEESDSSDKESPSSSSEESPSEESSSSSSSEESSTSSSSSEQESSEESSDSDSQPEGGDSQKVAVGAGAKVNAPSVLVPQAPQFRDDWPKLEKDPVEKDVLTYKILEVGADWTPEVTDWRYGMVSAFDTTTRTVTLVPWPDMSSHPDPKIRCQLESLGKDVEMEDDTRKHLDLPQSEYQDDGTLHRNIADFLEVRIVESGTAVNSIKGSSGGGPSNGKAPQTCSTTQQHTPKHLKTPSKKLTRSQKRRLSRKKKHQAEALKGASMSANGAEKSNHECKKDVKSVDGTPLSGSDWNDVEKMLAEKRLTIIEAAEQGSPVQRYHGSSMLGVLAHIRKT